MEHKSEQSLLSFEGRLNRQPLIGAFVCIWVLGVVLDAASGWLFGPDELTEALTDVAIALVLVWPLAAVWAKRFHDLGLSGWTVLMLFVPVVGLLPMIMGLCMRGTAGDNRYGPDPLAGEAPAGEPGSTGQAAA